MELPLNDVVKQGYLRFKGKMGMWQRQFVLLKKPSSKGGRRLERYPDERSSRTRQQVEKPIDLDTVTSVTRLPPDMKKHALAVIFKDKSSRSFCCESEVELEAWLVALQSLCLSGSTQQSVNSIDLLQSGPSQKELTELFNVYLLPSLNLAFYGECMLQVTQENLHLLETTNLSRRLVTWPLNALRRYGSDDNKFTFESGRSCPTGEGMFIMTTKDGDSIYKKVHAATLAIAEMHRLESWQNQTRRRNTEPALTGLGQPISPPLRSMSTPDPHPNVPSTPPPPLPAGSGPGLRKTSAVNLALPRVPGTAAPPATIDLYYDDVGGPPAEQAPRPPHPTSPSHGRAEYVPMAAHQELDEYVGLKERVNPDYMSVKGPRHYVNDPVGGAGPPGQQQGEEEYLYAEKGLSPAFRSYLKERKSDDPPT